MNWYLLIIAILLFGFGACLAHLNKSHEDIIDNIAVSCWVVAFILFGVFIGLLF